MTVVVADTSPLNYLVEIGCEGVLPVMYGEILVTRAVMGELLDLGAPTRVREFMKRTPAWLVLANPAQNSADPALDKLDPGEREAIQLAHERRADLLLMDERIGVKIARSRGLEVTGTLGILVEASGRKLIGIEEALQRLATTSFRSRPGLFESVLRLVEITGNPDFSG